jgi:hypothetical protein
MKALIDSYLLVENREAAVVEDVCDLERCEMDPTDDFGRSNADRLSIRHESATPRSARYYVRMAVDTWPAIRLSTSRIMPHRSAQF